MRKRDALAKFKKTVKSCLENVEYVFDENDLNVSYTYIPKFHYIHYDDDFNDIGKNSAVKILINLKNYEKNLM